MVPQSTPTGKPLTGIQAAWLRALAKAKALGVEPTQVGGGLYRVIGSRGNCYTVRRLNPECTKYACDCPAGEEGRICYHQAAVAALPYEVAGRQAHWRRQAVAARKAAREAAGTAA